MAAVSTTGATQFVSIIRDHFEKEGVDLSQVASLEIQCKNAVQMDFINKKINDLNIQCTSDKQRSALQTNAYSFFNISPDNNVETTSSCITLSVEKTKELVKRSFTEKEIDKHKIKFLKQSNEELLSICAKLGEYMQLAKRAVDDYLEESEREKRSK